MRQNGVRHRFDAQNLWGILVIRLKHFRSPSIQIILGTIISLGLSVGSVWLIGTASNKPSIGLVLGIIVVYFLSYIVPIVILALALYRSFQTTISPAVRFRLILLSYASMILVFTGVYFNITFAGDHEYSVDQYYYYLAAADRMANGNIQLINPYPTPSRAFTGIEDRLWGTLDDWMPRGIYMGLENIESYRARWARQLVFEGVVKFRPNSVPLVLSDCLHLSVITITTVGYGNISPRTWDAKLATNFEALTGTMLLIVALGSVLSDFGKRNQPST